MKEDSNDMLTEDVRASIEKIVPRDGGRERMYDNILKKAEKRQKHGTGQDMALRYALPVAACLCIVIAGAVYGINKDNTHSGNTGNINVTTEESFDDENVMGGNPFSNVDGSEAFLELGIDADAPENAENVSYSIIDGEIADISFELDGHEYLFRASYQSGDFTGIYGEEISAEIIDAQSSACLYVVSDGIKNYTKVHWSDGRVNYYLANMDGADKDTVKDIALGLTDKTK